METEKVTLKTYLKVIYGMALVALSVGFVLYSWKGAFLFFGAFLLMEHLYSWNDFTFKDIIGHEWLGAVCLIIGIIWFKSYWAIIPVVIAIGLNIDFKQPFKNEFKILWNNR